MQYPNFPYRPNNTLVIVLVVLLVVVLAVMFFKKGGSLLQKTLGIDLSDLGTDDKKETAEKIDAVIKEEAVKLPITKSNLELETDAELLLSELGYLKSFWGSWTGPYNTDEDAVLGILERYNNPTLGNYNALKRVFAQLSKKDLPSELKKNLGGWFDNSIDKVQPWMLE